MDACHDRWKGAVSYFATTPSPGSEYDGLDRLQEFRRGWLASDYRSIRTLTA
jgi:hypothetical protein